MVEGTDASVLSVSLSRQGDVWCDVQSVVPSGSHGVLHSPWGRAAWQVPMPGRHNITNAMQALAMACAHGEPFDQAVHAISQAAAPTGRLQRVEAGVDGPTVLVDFAHTDGALESVLSATREAMQPYQQMIVVFGCGGDRDRSKRARMGRVASTLADQVWITSDNPRTESPQAIIDDILEGVPHTSAVHVESDRAEAIRQAITASSRDDVIVIAGKGHEQVQLIGNQAIPFDDVYVARSCLQKDHSA